MHPEIRLRLSLFLLLLALFVHAVVTPYARAEAGSQALTELLAIFGPR